MKLPAVWFVYFGPFRLGWAGCIQWSVHAPRDFWSGWHFGVFAA